MKKTLFKYQISGFIFTCILGTLLHFVYDWSGKNIITATFSAVNESTWEHMKILFMPMFVFALWEKHILSSNTETFWCIKLRGIMSGIISIPLLFYTYNGVIGTSAPWINIAIFYISAFISFYIEYRLFQNKDKIRCRQTMAFSFICIIFLAFLVFTFVQPHLMIFRDPVTNTFGIQ